MIIDIELPQDVQAIVDELEPQFDDMVFTGSQIIGGAKPDSDWDFVVACSEGELNLKRIPAPDTTCGRISCEHTRKITTYRFGKVNLIVDHRGPQILDNWRIATDYCIEHGLVDKTERIKAFEMLGAG